jgi:CheY-like chemotaxis protein
MKPMKRHQTQMIEFQRKPNGAQIPVAEDNYTNQKIAEMVLEGFGTAVTVVNNGEEAIQAVREASFDAVLMDIQMPEMDGYEATEAIRAMPASTNLPIIAMTASTMSDDEQKCLDIGMNGYTSKPIDQYHLLSILCKHVKIEHTIPFKEKKRTRLVCKSLREFRRVQGPITRRVCWN